METCKKITREEFTLKDFFNKWQRQPYTELEIREYEDDQIKVGLRPSPHYEQEPPTEKIPDNENYIYESDDNTEDNSQSEDEQ